MGKAGVGSVGDSVVSGSATNCKPHYRYDWKAGKLVFVGWRFPGGSIVCGYPAPLYEYQGYAH